ncbi:hypothetical protein FA951_03630 [Dermacoccus nishinomiyaensis]|uniref:AAA family ATPase n=1 Tax=Dermacoccus nishinomiyaensis TaxID=1274 RepID=UPI0010ACF8AF|nr:AAA family ATPase [Dermacoccus nishinomiyaensis]TJZ97587.1 hypothetical protein FA951_03630 [Dermacoccus nishinomiyaensis]
MRLHSLTLEAFGPFPGREHIDFDALDQGILLINGPTGSGKSSLLDAIAFALFGDVPGARKSLRQSLRSHHAEPFAEPRVELEFSVGRTRWRVQRTPQWEAPKRRGTGTTTRQASVLLSQWRDNAWHLVSQRIDEAADMMSDTLGMRLEQFAQVVLLPQGEFAQFLRAKPEDRRILLERLFDVSRFDAVETWFTEAKNQRARERDASLERIRSHLTIIDDALARLDEPLEAPFDVSVDAPSADAVSADVAELPERLRAVVREVTERRDALEHAARASEVRARRASRAADDEAARTLLRARAQQAADVIAEWPADRLASVRRILDDAASVAGALRLHARAGAAAADAERAVEAVTRAETALRERGVHVPESGWPSPELTDGWFEAVSDALRHAESSARDVASAQTREVRAVAQLQDAEARLAEAQAATTRAEGAVTRAGEQHDQVATLVATLPDPSDAQAALARLRREAARRPELAHALAKAEERETEAVRTHAAAEREVLRLREARLAGIAGELGAALAPDEPCPVCGSATHPSPASPADDAPGAEQIEQAEQRAGEADAARLRAGASASAARERLRHLDEAVTAHHDELRVAVEALADDLSTARAQDDPTQLRHLDHVETTARRLGHADALRTWLSTDDDDGARKHVAPAAEVLGDNGTPAGDVQSHDASLDDGAPADDERNDDAPAEDARAGEALADAVTRALTDLTTTAAALCAETTRARTALSSAEAAHRKALSALSAAEERCAGGQSAVGEARTATEHALGVLATALQAVPSALLAALGVEWPPRSAASGTGSYQSQHPSSPAAGSTSPGSLMPAQRMEAVADELGARAEAAKDQPGSPAPLEPSLVAAALAAVTERRRLIDDVERAQRDAQHAEQAASSAAQAVADELAVAGHDTIEQARALALPEDERARLDATCNDAVRRVAAAQTSLEDEQVRIAAFTPAADPARLAQRAEVLTRRAQEATTDAVKWQQTHAVLDSVRHKVADAVRTYLPMAERAAETAELAASFTGTGENTRRMRLTSYVLAAHLETVTQMANERLATMTDGRYQLRYTDERAKGNQRSGLGLLVVDAWTGRSRDTATLSGGEAFMASLALALGLGDAVRADSGGLELHTLFVDEGFGSLDQDTLEQVMEVLDSLREGGRLVGVVSHVTELRARIPTHVEVVKTSEGSSVRTTSAPGHAAVPNAVSTTP